MFVYLLLGFCVCYLQTVHLSLAEHSLNGIRFCFIPFQMVLTVYNSLLTHLILISFLYVIFYPFSDGSNSFSVPNYRGD